MESRVALARVRGYEPEGLRERISRSLELLGGLEKFVPTGARVFVKVNLLPPPSPPDRAIITHPAFTGAVLSLLREITPHITVGDDVGGEESFAVSGYRDQCQRLGVELLNLREKGFARVRIEGEKLKEIYVAKAALEADVVLNLPKLKTHSLTLLTGAVKNLYGVIPAGLRTRLHGEHPRPQEFSRVLVDIFSTVKPSLTLMDGIVAMEGAGPAGGTPRDIGVIIVGADAVAVDAVASAVVGIEPFQVWTTRIAHDRGLGVGDLRRIEVLGEALSAVKVAGFRTPPAMGALVGRLPPLVTRWAVRRMQAQPAVIRERCVGCFACVRVCPAGAAKKRGDRAWIERGRCIRCMCCHEACRYDAIALKLSPVGKLFHRAQGLARRRA